MDVYIISNSKSFRDSAAVQGSDVGASSSTVSPSPTATPLASDDRGSGGLGIASKPLVLVVLVIVTTGLVL